MRVLYKLVMFLCGSLCALIMLVVGEPTIAGCWRRACCWCCWMCRSVSAV